MAFKFHRHLVATALVAAITLPALAQTSASPAAAAPTMGAEPTSQRDTPRMRHHGHADHKHGAKQGQTKDRSEHRAKRMAMLKDKLQLTGAQEAAWTSYTTALQPTERTARLDRSGMAQLTTPERIDRMRALRAQRAAEADRRGEVTKAFYAALAPEQQKTFDTQSWRGHRMGGKQQGMGMGGHHGDHKGHGKRHGHGHGNGPHASLHSGQAPAATLVPAPVAQ